MYLIYPLSLLRFLFFFSFFYSLVDGKNEFYLVRPKANEVFFHPFFEDLHMKVKLLTDVYFHCRKNKDLHNELESKVPIFGDSDWLSRYLVYSGKYCNSPKQPFEDFKVRAMDSMVISNCIWISFAYKIVFTHLYHGYILTVQWFSFLLYETSIIRLLWAFF